jgi:hypothetical protein
MGIKISGATFSNSTSGADGKARSRRVHNASPGHVAVVQCDVCGRLYGSDSLTAHKRLAHEAPDLVSTGQRETQKILRLFKELSQGNKKKVLQELNAMAEARRDRTRS